MPNAFAALAESSEDEEEINADIVGTLVTTTSKDVLDVEEEEEEDEGPNKKVI